MAYQTSRERKEKQWTRESWEILSRVRGDAFLMGMKITVQNAESQRVVPGAGGTSVEASTESDFGAVMIVATPSMRPASVCPKGFFKFSNVHRIVGAQLARDDKGDTVPIEGRPGCLLYNFLTPAPLQGKAEATNSRLTVEVSQRNSRVFVMIQPGQRPLMRPGAVDRRPMQQSEWDEDRRLERKQLQLLGSLIMNALPKKAGGQGVSESELGLRSVGRPGTNPYLANILKRAREEDNARPRAGHVHALVGVAEVVEHRQEGSSDEEGGIPDDEGSIPGEDGGIPDTPTPAPAPATLDPAPQSQSHRRGFGAGGWAVPTAP